MCSGYHINIIAALRSFQGVMSCRLNNYRIIYLDMERYQYLDQTPDFVQEAIRELGASAVYPILVILTGDRFGVEELVGGGVLSKEKMRSDVYERSILITQNSRKT